MNRNTESQFAQNPANLGIERSKFDRSCQHKTTFNCGDLVPIFVDEVLPGDTFSLDLAAAVRMSTPVFPVMDNAFLDYYFFFVPNRLCWEHWKEFCGENNSSHWAQPVEYEIPQIKAPATTGWTEGTIADYMGIPTGVDNISVSALPFRAYCLIWNEWFRDQNLKDPAHVNLDDATQQGSNDGDYVINAELGAKPLKVAKVHDYFTSCLPEPQKGPDVLLPLSGLAYVRAGTDRPNVAEDEYSVHWAQFGTGDYPTAEKGLIVGSDGAMRGKTVTSSGDPFGPLVPANLYADLTTATAATINQLRQSFALQRLYERDARGGTRYTEIIRAHFNVVSPDSRMQRPEYLGGARIPISVDQVLQTSSTDDTSPQGNTAAYSLSNYSDSAFTKSFTEHGFIIGLACVRHDLTYQQGIERFWSRKKRFDFYYPALANIGEQPVYNKEIYAQGTSEDDEAFGYQEAWADYRYKPNRVSGTFRSGGASLDAWHYADHYASLPALSSEWIDQGDASLKRTLASQTEDEFLADFYFRCTCVRPMPLYSIPGLLDHN